jgi:hypothetical protein
MSNTDITLQRRLARPAIVVLADMDIDLITADRHCEPAIPAKFDAREIIVT